MEVLVRTPADADEVGDSVQMCVSTPRRKLEEMGLDVNGSREMLIRRLEQGEHDDSSASSCHCHNLTS